MICSENIPLKDTTLDNKSTSLIGVSFEEVPLIEPNDPRCPWEWRKDGELHSYDDKPGLLFSDGSKIWYKEGKIHRDNDLPAAVYAYGQEEWWVDGNPHRDDDKPAVININGSKAWYKHGEKHRDGGLPAVIREKPKEGYSKPSNWCGFGAVIDRPSREWWVDGEFIRSE